MCWWDLQCGCSETGTGLDRPRRRARHASARTVTQYAARSWLPVASTIHALARTATYAPTRPRHRHSSAIHALARTATVPVPPIRRLAPAQSARMRTQQPQRRGTGAQCDQHNPHACAHGNRTDLANPPLVASAQSTLLCTRQPHKFRRSTVWH